MQPYTTHSLSLFFRLVVGLLLQGALTAQITQAQSIPAPSPVPEEIMLWNEADANTQNWMFHFQNTAILQGQPDFNSPYQGPNSLDPAKILRHTISADIFLGAHLWPGIYNETYPGHFRLSIHCQSGL